MAGIGKGNTLSHWLPSFHPTREKVLRSSLSYAAGSRRACFRDSQNTPNLEPHSNTSAPPPSHPHSPHVEGDISLPLIPMRAFDALLGHPRCTGGRWSSSVPSPTLGRHVGFFFSFPPRPAPVGAFSSSPHPAFSIPRPHTRSGDTPLHALGQIITCPMSDLKSLRSL